MSDSGWIPAYRKMFEPGHWLAPNGHDPASRLHAWLDLCQMATHKPRKHRHLSLERGQVIVSLRSLAKRWRWHLSSVQRFISELKVSTSLSTVTETPDGTIYQIVNYDTYAVGEKPNETPTETQVNTAAKQEQEGKKPKKTSLPRRKLSELPPDWVPNEAHVLKATETHLDLPRQAEKFRHHHRSKGNRFLSWDDAFHTWLGNAAEWARGSNGNGNGNHVGQGERWRPGILRVDPT